MNIYSPFSPFSPQNIFFFRKLSRCMTKVQEMFSGSTFEISEFKSLFPIQIHSIRNSADFPQCEVSFSFELQTNAMINPIYLIYSFINLLPNYSSCNLCFTSPSTSNKEFQYSFPCGSQGSWPLTINIFPCYKVVNTTYMVLIPRFKSRNQS